MDRPEIILAPGPTPIPPEVLLAQGSPLVYHRGPGFGKLMRDVTDRLRQLYRTEDADVLLMTSSGTGGLESAIQNCFSPGDEVFVPNAGFFAERWKRARRGVRAHRADGRLRVGREDPPRGGRRGARGAPGEGGTADAERDLDRRDPARSSELARVANDAGALVVVDVVSLARRGAVRLRRVGDRRRASAARRRRCPPRPASRSSAISERAWAGAAHRDEPALLLRLGDLQAVRRRCPTPRTRGRRRSA